ncbi:MAG: twin-arginine translocase subunit TatC [Anaerolineae bacterium]|nr:twin-arginine translocase subunit TatC [Anaerolineae bacterium]
MARFLRWMNPFRAAPKRDPEAHMTLLQHLDELRMRVTRALFGLVLGTAVGMVFATEVLKFLQEPYGREFTVLGPTGGVVAYFRVALFIGAILSIPLVTYQVLMFVLPGLHPHEKRVLLAVLPVVTLLFLVGVVFTWYVLIPPALGFLEGFEPTLFKPEWTADLYLSFVTALVFWMGVAFEMPLIFFVLALMGFVEAGVLIRQWRIAVVGAAVAAAVITPTVDPVNMALVVVPLLALYGISIGLVGLGASIHKRRISATS